MTRDLPINQVSWLCTHNAFNSQDEINTSSSYIGGTNQNHDIHTQLEDGVRVFMIDVHNFHNAPRVGHGEGASTHYEDLPDLLAKYKSWLDTHSDEIIILIMEVAGDVPAKWINNSFKNAFGTLLYHHYSPNAVSKHTKNQDKWPSINELIEKKKQVIVFRETDDGKGQKLKMNMEWYHDMWTYWIETPYGNSNWKDLQQHTYELLRGNASRACFFNLNHFVNTGHTGSGSAGFAEGMNRADYLKTRALIAWKMHGRIPSLSVDFYKSVKGAGPDETYNTLKVADELNKMATISGIITVEFDFPDGSSPILFPQKVTWEGLNDLTFSDYLPNDYRVANQGDRASEYGVPSSHGGEFCFPGEGKQVTLKPTLEGYTLEPESITWDGKVTLKDVVFKAKNTRVNG